MEMEVETEVETEMEVEIDGDGGRGGAVREFCLGGKICKVPSSAEAGAVRHEVQLRAQVSLCEQHAP